MKYSLLLLVAALAAGQSVVSTATTDLNGRRVESPPSVSTNGMRTELGQSINGGQVPLEQTESKVLREDANGKVVETIVRKYSPSGQLASTERVVTDTQKTPDGSVARSTTYRSDINGTLREAERSVTESHQQGAVSRAETVVERPTLNSSFETVEKRSTVTETSGDNSHQDLTVLRRSTNGDFDTVLREVKDKTKNGDQTVENTALYEPRDSAKLELSRQTVTKTAKASDGSEVSEVNLYRPSVPGIAQSSGTSQQLYEQQIISRSKGPGDTVVETLSVRRPTVSDPTHLGNVQKVSETVCSGTCTPDKP
jgi:hypothetical protein